MPDYKSFYARYDNIIPDFDLFIDAVQKPSPSHIRVNTLKTTSEELLPRLAARGIFVDSEDWSADMFRVRQNNQPLGTTVEHAVGNFYLQSASSAAAAMALDAKPGDWVLDLCAAPGSKTTYIAQAMNNDGIIVANEPNRSRSTPLVGNLERVGVSCAVVTYYGGQNFPARHQFDRVLVDAPCSGEGTWRGPDSRPKITQPGFRNYLNRQQSAVLRQGYEALKPGGILVYSTCAYAPEENEAIVSAFLRETGAEVLPLNVDIERQPGLTAWEGEEFCSQMSLASRLYPHAFDSEGFFLVRLTKNNAASPKRKPRIVESNILFNGSGAALLSGTQDIAAAGEARGASDGKRSRGKMPEPRPGRLDAERTSEVLSYLKDYFGIPSSVFSEYSFIAKGDYIYAVKNSCVPILETLRFSSVGIQLLKPTGKSGFRPATRGFQAFGRWATKRVCELDEEAAAKLLQGQSLPGEYDDPGFYLLKLNGMILGLGLVRNGGLVAQLPRSLAEQISFKGKSCNNP